MGWSNLIGWFTLACKGLRALFTLGACCILGPRALSTLGDCLSIVADSSLSIFSLDSLLQLPSDQLLSVFCNVSSAVIWASVALSVGTLSNGYTRSGPLSRVAPFRTPIAKLTRALAAHMSTITNAPYLGTFVGEHIT